MKKLFSALVFSSVLCLSANSWADTTPIDEAAEGMAVSATAIATTVATPIFVLDHLVEGNLPEAAGTAVVLPVKGVVNTAAGAVMTVSGIGRGAVGLLDLAFDATGKAAKQTVQPTENNLP